MRYKGGLSPSVIRISDLLITEGQCSQVLSPLRPLPPGRSTLDYQQMLKKHTYNIEDYKIFRGT